MDNKLVQCCETKVDADACKASCVLLVTYVQAAHNNSPYFLHWDQSPVPYNYVKLALKNLAYSGLKRICVTKICFEPATPPQTSILSHHSNKSYFSYILDSSATYCDIFALVGKVVEYFPIFATHKFCGT